MEAARKTSIDDCEEAESHVWERILANSDRCVNCGKIVYWTLKDEEEFIDGLGEHAEKNRIKLAGMDEHQARDFIVELLTKYIAANKKRPDVLGRAALAYARRKRSNILRSIRNLKTK